MADSLSLLAAVRDRLGAFLGFTHNGARNLYQQFGYKQVLQPQDFMGLYLRNGVANRIVRAFPKATWRDPPVIWDEQGNSPEKGENFSSFSASVAELFNTAKVYSYLERADRVSSIGRYGLLVMGFRDGSPMASPLREGKHPLIYLGVYGDTNLDVQSWDNDPQSPRYGLPTIYSVTTGSMISNTGGQPSQRRSFHIHWTRCLHIAEHLEEDDVFAQPRLQPGFNWLVDLEKTVGASAETFWLNASFRMALTADKDVQLTESQITDMKEQADLFEHQLRRVLALQGVQANVLNAAIADPGPNVDKLMDVIAGTYEIPKRILIGSERGELSSEQDENNWAQRIKERRLNFATPCILKPFLERMVMTGNIEEPQGEWGADWPDEGQTPEKEANVGLVRSNALRNYVMSPGASIVVPVAEFRQNFLGLPPQTEFDEGDEDLLLEPALDPANQDGQNADGQNQDGTPPDGQGGNGDNADGNAGAADSTDGNSGDEPAARAPRPALSLDAARRLKKFVHNGRWRIVGASGLLEYMQINRELKTNTKPRTLYVYRPVLNADEIQTWARKEGFSTILPDLHVTIAHSKSHVDWMKIGPDWCGDDQGRVIVKPGGPRQVEPLGNQGAIVLLFNDDGLAYRHKSICGVGASWDYDHYQPHVTLTYELDDLDLDEVVPYNGKLLLGPEVFEEVQENYQPEEIAI